MRFAVAGCFELLGRPQRDSSLSEGLCERSNYDLCSRWRHSVANLSAHTWIHGPRFKFASSAAVFEHESVWEALQASFFPVAQAPGLGVVVTMSPTTTPGDNRVGRLVGIQTPIDVTDQAPNCQRMPLRDDFVVASGRD